MKKITAFLLILCMIFPNIVFAETETDDCKVYIFGDDWAAEWGNVLKGYFYDEENIINAAQRGDLLSGLSKKAEYAAVKKGDIVILSYGILEKDRPGDKNADYKKNLESITDTLTKKGAKVIFVSIVSSMRYNTLTGHMDETKNFYTETTRSFAKSKSIAYIDLANLTATWANKMGSSGASRLYKGVMTLTDNGNRMCAYEVFKEIKDDEGLFGKIKLNLSQVHTVNTGERSKTVDVFFEEALCDYFTVYIKGGSNVTVNSVLAPDGDSTVICKAEGGKINLSFAACEKIQVTPSYRFDAAGFETTSAPFERSVTPGLYDVTVQKTEPLKASVYLNGYLIASNLDMPGTQPVPVAAEHTYSEYHLYEDKIKVTVTGLTDKLNYIALRESPVIYDYKPRVFVGGDSTVCNYYPLLRTGQEADGTVMTGWAMLLENYVNADVVNLAASGDWATKWKESSFNIIEKEGRKGDIFIVQFGINDRYNSSIEDMAKALGEMIDTAAAKGMIPILVSPQISAGYGWGDESNVGKSDGGDYEEYFKAVKLLAEEKGCFHVDLTDLSSGWFSEIGRDAVYKKYHLWDYENNTPGDMMHLSYKGADAMCSFFVLGLTKIKESNQADKWGNTLELLKIW